MDIPARDEHNKLEGASQPFKSAKKRRFEAPRQGERDEEDHCKRDEASHRYGQQEEIQRPHFAHSLHFPSQSRSIPNDEGEVVSNDLPKKRRTFSESYYPQAASRPPRMLPPGQEATQLVERASPGFAIPLGAEAKRPHYPTSSWPVESHSGPNAASIAYMEALRQRFRHPGNAALTTSSKTAAPWHLCSYDYDNESLRRDSDSHRRSQIYPTFAEFGGRLPQSQASYFEQTVLQEADRRLKPEQHQIPGPYIFPDAAMTFLSHGQSLSVEQSLLRLRMLLTNDYNLASLTSPTVLAQQRLPIGSQRFNDRVLDPLSRQHLSPLTSLASSSLLASPLTTTELVMAERSRRGHGERLIGSTLSPLATVCSSRHLSLNPYPSNDSAKALTRSNGDDWQERDDSNSCASDALESSGANPMMPPCVEGPLPPHSERTVLSLSIDEDESNLSDVVCFVRSELVEVFRAGGEDVVARIHNKRIVYHQVGLRCKFCAHLPRDERSRRAATFPSSIDRIQQSLSLIIREHFVHCKEVPERIKAKYNKLKAEQTTAKESRRKSYWNKAARQLGLVDTSDGIMFHTDVHPSHQPPGFTGAEQATFALGPFSPTTAPLHGLLESPRELLIDSNDRPLVPDFLFFLMSQAQRISLNELEMTYNQKKLSLPLNMPGFGCRHCCETNMGGENRFFPQRRRFLQSNAKLLYQHLEQCPRCPREVKVCLALLKSNSEDTPKSNDEDEKEKAFFARIWARLLGHIPAGRGVPAELHGSGKSIDLES